MLTSKEIESVQGEPLQDSKSSGGASGVMAVSQCYFGLPTAANSISLTVLQKSDGPNAHDPKEYWKEMFHRDKGAAKERGEEREGKKAEPEKVDNVGDEAFWLGNGVDCDLYVLKGEQLHSDHCWRCGRQNFQAREVKKAHRDNSQAALT